MLDKLGESIKKITDNFSKEDFIFDFLLAFNTPNSTITRLKKGELNKLKEKGELLLRKKVFFKNTNNDLYSIIDSIKNDLKDNKSKPRFVIVTNFDKFLAFDTKVNVGLDIDFKQLHKYHDFFLPLVGIEKQEYQNENVADVKAANNLAKLFDEIVKDNAHDTAEQRHALNIFLSRLLFCYFAEDTNIFTTNKFTSSLGSHTKLDGSDTHLFLEKLFKVFDLKDRDSSLPEYLNSFPYVNGKLFKDIYEIPKFTTKSRKLLIELGELDWSGINPDIFGSMMQAVMDSDERGNMGSHYTSVPNIMKVINPLFLDELKEDFENSIGNNKKLNLLLDRISKIKFFDPACGSGNFLIITYKEIRSLEIEILKEMGIGPFTRSNISLSQFYGIELNDFAHETAKLSLYLAEHQMNVEFYQETGISTVSLPLKLGGNIVCGNATRLDWEEVCLKEEGDEIYIMGNPPYLGARLQDSIQKEDMKHIFQGRPEYKDSDYILCWFIKSADYIQGNNIKFSFVSTNSISQGEQISFLWPYVFEKNLEIFFAHSPFKWNNNAKGNAGVICVIVGVRNTEKKIKKIFGNNISHIVENINPYLICGRTVIINGLKEPISDFPKMVMGNMPRDGGNLILSTDEKIELLKKYPEGRILLRKFYGAQEFLQGKERWCLWITDKLINIANNIPPIKEKIDKVYEFRIKSKAKTTNGYASIPYKLAQRSHKETNSIIIPRVSSERRKYIPFGFLDKNSIISDGALAIYDAESWIFGVLISNMHMIWVKSVAGRLKSDYRYSKNIVYNTFPFPYITKKQKEEIEEYVYNILDEREKHSEKTLAEMYDPDKMPEGLKQAHHELDLVIEGCYRPKPFESDEERLEYLFKMYEKMIAKENKK